MGYYRVLVWGGDWKFAIGVLGLCISVRVHITSIHDSRHPIFGGDRLWSLMTDDIWDFFGRSMSIPRDGSLHSLLTILLLMTHKFLDHIQFASQVAYLPAHIVVKVAHPCHIKSTSLDLETPDLLHPCKPSHGFHRRAWRYMQPCQRDKPPWWPIKCFKLLS